jgi:2-desacetyl-2-hydroxyethyl bacteriochlorophyllide A dehydrogenase
MRGVVARDGRVSVEDVPEPSPAAGQVLVAPVACGICGSDLHALEIQAADPAALPPVVLGHEFCAEILDYGPGTNRRIATGTLVCSVPFIDGPGGPELLGFAPNFPGGLAERMLLQESRMVPVPADLDAHRAALTEPLAVGLHAVGAAGLGADDVALVLGCGPVGLAVIAGLRSAGHGPIVAADFSATRRRLAELTGADVVLDPAQSSPYEAWLDLAGAPGPPSPLLTTSSFQANTVAFDCVGAPGLLQQLIESVPQHSRLVVVGVCALPDTITPVAAIEKELSVRFVFAYRPDEFAAALGLIAAGTVDVKSWITDARGLDGVREAFDELSAPDKHGKILVNPGG